MDGQGKAVQLQWMVQDRSRRGSGWSRKCSCIAVDGPGNTVRGQGKEMTSSVKERSKIGQHKVKAVRRSRIGKVKARSRQGQGKEDDLVAERSRPGQGKVKDMARQGT